MNKGRLFFAIFPEEKLCHQLSDFARSILKEADEKITRPDMMHITLRYIGPVSDDIRQCLISKVDVLKTSSFDISLNKTGFWKKPQVSWSGPDIVDERLLELVNKLENISQQCGVANETKKYIPHLTLLRKARSSTQIKMPIVNKWHVKNFTLIESVSVEGGVQYNHLKDWSLQ